MKDHLDGAVGAGLDRNTALSTVEWIGGGVLGGVVRAQHGVCALCAGTLRLKDPVLEWARYGPDGDPFPFAVHRTCAAELPLSADRLLAPLSAELAAVVERGPAAAAVAVRWAAEALERAAQSTDWRPAEVRLRSVVEERSQRIKSLLEQLTKCYDECRRLRGDARGGGSAEGHGPVPAAEPRRVVDLSVVGAPPPTGVPPAPEPPPASGPVDTSADG